MKQWSAGMPPFPWSSEWFLVKLTDGSIIELFPLTKGWSHRWRDREETFYTDDWAKQNVLEWKQKENSEFYDFRGGDSNAR